MLRAATPPPPMVRRRKAALTAAAILPHELLAQLVESGELVGEGDDLRLAAAADEPGKRDELMRAAAEAAAAVATVNDDEATGQPAGRTELGAHEDAFTAVGSAAAAAPQASHQAPKPSTPATVGQLVFSSDPLPAYTSLARQQLQQRLKAAIAAGTRPQPVSHRHALQARPPAGLRQALAQQQSAGLLGAGVAYPATSFVPGLRTLPGVAPAQPSLGMPVGLSLPAADLLSSDSGFQLLLLSSSSGSGSSGSGSTSVLDAAGTAGKAGQRSAGNGKFGQLIGAGTGIAEPHWLGAHLLQQPLYIVTPRQDSRHEPKGRQQHQPSQQSGVQRGLLALQMPPLSGQFTELMPVRVGNEVDSPCLLLVLPSDGPSSRQEAEAAAAALHQMLCDPAAAAQRAAAWREQLLLASSSAALLGLTADYAPVHHAQQLRQAHPRKAGASGVLAGAAWLAGRSSGSSLAGVSIPAGAVDDTAVRGVRSSTSFLRADSKGSVSRSASPLPPLVPPGSRSASRLGIASPLPPAAAACVVAECEESVLQAERSSSCIDCHSSFTCFTSAAAVAAAAAEASQVQALPGPPPPPPPVATDPTWDAYCCASLAAGLAACMAELVRQVEVGCAERGRLLAQLWNSYTGVLGATIQQQQQQLEALSSAHANLTADVAQLRWEVSSMSFLRSEISRLRKDAETVALELDDCRHAAVALREAAEDAEEGQEELARHLRRRLAALRWRLAAAAVMVPGWRSRAQHSVEPEKLDNPLLQQVAALERAAAAVVEAQQQRREARQRSRAEAALTAVLSMPAANPQPAAGASQVLESSGASSPRHKLQRRLQHAGGGIMDQASVGAAAPAFPGRARNLQRQSALSRVAVMGANAPGGSSSSSSTGSSDDGIAGGSRAASSKTDGSASVSSAAAAAVAADASALAALTAAGGSSSLGLLRSLRPEARLVLLMSQPVQQRQVVLGTMSDAERAALVVMLEDSARLQLYEEMGSALAVSTDAFIARKPLLLARQLAMAPPEQAATQFASRLTPQQQALLLQAAPPKQAAALLMGQQPESQRQRLLQGMSPAAAAAMLEWVLPSTTLQLILGVASAPARPACSQDSLGWVSEVLGGLADRHLSASLAAAQPGELATLLDRLSAVQQQRVLQLLPQAGRAAALAVAHQREAAAARRRAAAAAEQVSREHDVDVTAAVKAAVAAGGTQSLELLHLDPGTSLLAHFQQLSAAEKTSLLLMGSAQAAALLLPLLGDGEVGDVLLLLPRQRQEQLLRALHPDQERRIQGVARQANERRSSLLLPHQLALAAEATEAEGDRRLSSLPPPQQLATAVEAVAAEGGVWRGSMIVPPQICMEASPGSGSRRNSMIVPPHMGMEASPAGSRRSGMFLPQQTGMEVSPAGSGSRRSSMFLAQQTGMEALPTGNSNRRDSTFVPPQQPGAALGAAESSSRRNSTFAVQQPGMAVGEAESSRRRSSVFAPQRLATAGSSS